MLVTPELNRSNRVLATTVSLTIAVAIFAIGYFKPMILLALPLAYGVYWYMRRKTLRRIKVVAMDFPAEWESGLQSHVSFFRTLDPSKQDRFRNLVKVFLDEVPLTGVKTEVDELTRVLVAASAVIPIFGFDQWEYSQLGEVLIYPGRFNDEFQSGEGDDHNTLGMIGVNHLSGIMILSKPDLVAGFANPKDKRNVGIHEFAHLVDKADGSVDGIPVGVPSDVVRPWIQWVGKELKRPGENDHIDDYAFTNEAEYFAVLSEYFFEAPEILAKKDPDTYAMLEKMYRQNTRSSLSKVVARRPKRIGRNSPCPCGSGEKYKRCCRLNSRRGQPNP